MRRSRHPNLILASTIAPLTFALVWSITHGEVVGAVIAAVFWTFYVLIAVASLVVWRRKRGMGGASEPPAD